MGLGQPVDALAQPLGAAGGQEPQVDLAAHLHLGPQRPPPQRPGDDGEQLEALVTDEGVGLPEGFRIEDATGLGLSIVRSLVTSQMEGTIEMRPGPEGVGTVVAVRVPLVVTEHTER